MALNRRDFIEIGRQYQIPESEASSFFDMYERGFRETASPGGRMVSDDLVRKDIHLIMTLISAHRSGRISDEEFVQACQAIKNLVLVKVAEAQRRRAPVRKPGFFARLFGR